MIRRTCNFVDLENKGYWNDNMQAIRYELTRLNKMDYNKQELEQMFSYFNQLLALYPEVLSDEQIEKDNRRLIAYCKERGIPYKDAYTYIHNEKSDSVGVYKYTVGLKISNLQYYSENFISDNIVDIAYYDCDYNGTMLKKKKLRFKVINNRVIWGHLIYEDSNTNYLYEANTLEILKPKTYIK